MCREPFVSVLVGLLIAAGPSGAAAGEVPRGRELAAGTGPAKVAFAPDGKSVATAAGRKVTLWESANGHVRWTLAGHDKPVRALAFDPGGRTLATAARTGEAADAGAEVKIWDTRTGKLRRTLAIEGSDVNALAFSPDGRILVGGGLKGLWCWGAGTGELKHRMPAQAAVLAVGFSPDGRTLASGTFDEQVRLWDTAKWEVRRKLKGHRSEVRAVAFAPDGKTLASGGVGEVLIWDASNGDRLRALKTPSTVWALAFAPDGKDLAAGYGEPQESAEGGVRVWDAAGGNVRKSWANKGGAVVSMSFSPDGRMLADGRYDGVATLWESPSASKPRPGK